MGQGRGNTSPVTLQTRVFSLKSMWTDFLQDRDGNNAPKPLLKSFDDLSQMRVEMLALKVFREVFVPMDVALLFFLLVRPPHCFRGQFILIPSLGTLLGIVE